MFKFCHFCVQINLFDKPASITNFFYQHLQLNLILLPHFKSTFVAQLDRSNSTFAFPPVHTVLENIHSFYIIHIYYLFFIQVLNNISSTFYIQFITFFLYSFSRIFSPLRLLIICVHGTLFLTFLIKKKIFWPIWFVAFCKNYFIFWYSHIITNFEFRIFIIMLNVEVIIYACLNINKPHFDCPMVRIIVIINNII